MRDWEQPLSAEQFATMSAELERLENSWEVEQCAPPGSLHLARRSAVLTPCSLVRRQLSLPQRQLCKNTSLYEATDCAVLDLAVYSIQQARQTIHAPRLWGVSASEAQDQNAFEMNLDTRVEAQRHVSFTALCCHSRHVALYTARDYLWTMRRWYSRAVKRSLYIGKDTLLFRVYSFHGQT